MSSDNLESILPYWSELGYREIRRGQLSAEKAQHLYDHESELTSVRLQNRPSNTHGLIRIMVWQHPQNLGLREVLPITLGSHWFASLVEDIYALADAFTSLIFLLKCKVGIAHLTQLL